MSNPELHMYVQLISPDMANAFLKQNTRNRPLDLRRASRLAEAIQRGEWVLNGDTIRISESGVILDGQHRLKAISQAGVAVKTLVVSGLPDSVFETIDVGGAARTTGHVMAIRGEKHYNSLAALTRMYFIWRKSGDPTNGNPDNTPTTAQQIELAEDRRFAETVSETEKLPWCRKHLTPTMSAFCLHAFKEHNEELAREFFILLNSGAGLSMDSPVLLLRDRLTDSKSDKQQALSRRYALALVFKAFKLFRDGARVKNLRVRMDGNAPEKDLFVL